MPSATEAPPILPPPNLPPPILPVAPPLTAPPQGIESWSVGDWGDKLGHELEDYVALLKPIVNPLPPLMVDGQIIQFLESYNIGSWTSCELWLPTHAHRRKFYSSLQVWTWVYHTR